MRVLLDKEINTIILNSQAKFVVPLVPHHDCFLVIRGNIILNVLVIFHDVIIKAIVFF